MAKKVSNIDEMEEMTDQEMEDFDFDTPIVKQEEKRIDICIHNNDPGAAKDVEHFFSLNGRTFLIKFDNWVTVPFGLVELINHTEYTVEMPHQIMEGGQEITQMRPQTVRKFIIDKAPAGTKVEQEKGRTGKR